VVLAEWIAKGYTTMPEFLQAEADREGTTPVAIMDEIHQSFEDDNAKMREQITTNALAILQKDADEIRTHWEEGDEPIIRATEILTMLDVNYHQSFRGSNGGFTARVKCDDGKERFAVYSEFYDSGTRMDPPEGGAEVRYYDDCVLSEEEREVLSKMQAAYIDNTTWWKHSLRKSLEAKGCTSRQGNRTVLSVIGKTLMGIQ
jgi:hypothetical protein